MSHDTCRGIHHGWTLQWRHNGRDGVSNHQPHFVAQIKESTKAPRHWPLWGEFTGDKGPGTRKMLPKRLLFSCHLNKYPRQLESNTRQRFDIYLIYQNDIAFATLIGWFKCASPPVARIKVHVNSNQALSRDPTYAWDINNSVGKIAQEHYIQHNNLLCFELLWICYTPLVAHSPR